MVVAAGVGLREPEAAFGGVVVTGMHGCYNEHLSTHAVMFLLAFALVTLSIGTAKA